MLVSPSSAARRCAAFTIREEKSVEIKCPSPANRAMAAKPVSPAPAASSRRVWPGCGANLSTIHSPTAREASHTQSRRSSQPGAIRSQMSWLERRYSSRSVGGRVPPWWVAAFFLERAGGRFVLSLAFDFGRTCFRTTDFPLPLMADFVGRLFGAFLARRTFALALLFALRTIPSFPSRWLRDERDYWVKCKVASQICGHAGSAFAGE